MNSTSMERVREAAKKIRLLLLDVDGVLTDGKLYYSESGSESKAFNIQDGQGIKLLQHNGIEVGIITGRSSKLLARRASELGIERVVQGREDKLTALNELLETCDYQLEEIAHVGDDLPDVAVIRRVGLGIAVANANHFVAEHAQWQTSVPGGEGAIREVAELILSAQGKLDDTLAHFL
ncbi:HAD-IIIA family hydrolase [Porticoccus sp. W117]|uniref:KdsC family phosphatase n=1 Tax=Porticoccus sp. W117 TaxID=3054777 RepID=UPI0025998608|nr:HAD-IIIA family hydrolase [Porticoccus sp. W117]MDM3871275.1 HAD-IIIA family hydrolase [Porticoccus sp. W117]